MATYMNGDIILRSTGLFMVYRLINKMLHARHSSVGAAPVYEQDCLMARGRPSIQMQSWI